MKPAEKDPAGSKWALLIGVEAYHNSRGCLEFRAADAQLLCDALVSEFAGFKPENLPTYDSIRCRLASWLSRAREPDLLPAPGRKL